MTYPKMKPCPFCGSDERLSVYTYDSGTRRVECSMECGYLGPACVSIVWAIRNHNEGRDQRAIRYIAELKAEISKLADKAASP